MNFYFRNIRKAADSLFVMANHGQLLEYSLEPVHDQTIPRYIIRQFPGT